MPVRVTVAGSVLAGFLVALFMVAMQVCHMPQGWPLYMPAVVWARARVVGMFGGWQARRVKPGQGREQGHWQGRLRGVCSDVDGDGWYDLDVGVQAVAVPVNDTNAEALDCGASAAAASAADVQRVEVSLAGILESNDDTESR